MSDKPDFQNIPISAELLLAVLLKNVGEVEIPVSDLMQDYTNYQISVDQDRDDYVVFSLVGPDES